MKTKSALFKDYRVELRLFGVLLALMVILSLISDRFLTVDNLTNVLWSVCLIGIMTTGAIYAPITGGIDLSVASMAALAGILANVFMNTLGMNWIVAIVLTLVIGAGIGWLNGVVTTKFLVPAFIVTMAAKTYLFGVAMLVSNGDRSRSCSRHRSCRSASASSSASRSRSTSCSPWSSSATSC